MQVGEGAKTVTEKMVAKAWRKSDWAKLSAFLDQAYESITPAAVRSSRRLCNFTINFLEQIFADDDNAADKFKDPAHYKISPVLAGQLLQVIRVGFDLAIGESGGEHPLTGSRLEFLERLWDCGLDLNRITLRFRGKDVTPMQFAHLKMDAGLVEDLTDAGADAYFAAADKFDPVIKASRERQQAIDNFVTAWTGSDWPTVRVYFLQNFISSPDCGENSEGQLLLGDTLQALFHKNPAAAEKISKDDVSIPRDIRDRTKVLCGEIFSKIVLNPDMDQIDHRMRLLYRLRQSGVDLNKPLSTRGHTAIQLALLTGDQKLVQDLFYAGADAQALAPPKSGTDEKPRTIYQMLVGERTLVPEGTIGFYIKLMAQNSITVDRSLVVDKDDLAFSGFTCVEAGQKTPSRKSPRPSDAGIKAKGGKDRTQ